MHCLGKIWTLFSDYTNKIMVENICKLDKIHLDSYNIHIFCCIKREEKIQTPCFSVLSALDLANGPFNDKLVLKTK